jgi:hypothetical protein
MPGIYLWTALQLHQTFSRKEDRMAEMNDSSSAKLETSPFTYNSPSLTWSGWPLLELGTRVSPIHATIQRPLKRTAQLLSNRPDLQLLSR